MKQLLIVFIAIVISTFSLTAQEFVDVVYLKNGSIIKGKIIENNSEMLKIETCCGSIFVYNQGEVEKTEQVLVHQKKSTIKQKGYVNYTSFGALIGSSSNDKTAPFSLIMEHGYKFNTYFAVGGLIGYELISEATMPLAVNLKAYYPIRNNNLFIGMSGGYSFSLEDPSEFFVAYDNFSGGPMANAELGIILPFSEIGAFFMAIGFRHNKLNYERYDPWLGDIDGVIHYKRLFLRAGISFY